MSGPAPHRLLVLQAGPGPAALLLLACQNAIPRFDAVIALDTGWYPAQARRHLQRWRRIAPAAAPAWVRAATASMAEAFLQGQQPCPLPLFTRTPDGTPGRLANGCARRQAAALTAAIRRLSGPARPAAPPAGGTAECVLGLEADRAHHAPTAGPRFPSLRYPLIELGWSRRDCRAFLHRHGLSEIPDLACVACPNRSTPAWARLRERDPHAFEEALAVDLLIRHGPSTAAPDGIPADTTYYLHPERVPLERIDLDAPAATAAEDCLPWSRRGTEPGTGSGGGGAA